MLIRPPMSHPIRQGNAGSIGGFCRTIRHQAWPQTLDWRTMTEPNLRTIRLAGPADAGQIQAIYAPIVERTVISFESEPPDADEMRRRIASYGSYAPWLVCEAGGEILGYAYAGKHQERAAYRWAVNVSVYVGGSARRLGVGRALYAALFELL